MQSDEKKYYHKESSFSEETKEKLVSWIL